MTQSKTIFISTLTISLLVLAGCTTQTATNTNVVNNTNTTVNTNTANDNTNIVVTNSNENTNEVVNENTNSDQGSEVDTSDWLTYTNDEYGFSFKYPKDWQISKDIFEEYKKSFDNPKYQVNEKDVTFLTSLTADEISSEIYQYQNQTDEMGQGVIESIGKGKLISIAVSEKEVSDLISQDGFTFTIGSNIVLDQNIEATNVYMEKRWEGNSNYHYVYVPLQSNQLTNMGKKVKTVVFTIETSSNNYDQDALLKIVKTFRTNF